MTPAIALSSRLTLFMKITFPALWIAGFGAISAFYLSIRGVPAETGWLFFAAWILGTLSFWWWCIPLKRVRVVDDNLCISNFRKEIVVPLKFVERVTENRWVNLHPVAVHFCDGTEFGREISFMPKSRVMFFWSSHPVVGELRRMVEAAQMGSGT